MSRQYAFIKPLDKAETSVSPNTQLPFMSAASAVNVDVDQKSIVKRWGYGTTYRTLPAQCYGIYLFQKSDGSRYTLYLTAADLCSLESAGTYSYKTDTYTTGTVTNITAAVVTGNSTAWNTSGLAAGDKFILDDDHSATAENDTNWAQILTVDGATQITLNGSYTGTTGAMSKTYKARKVYTVPADERWSTATVIDRFCFSNGNNNVQVWTGANYAADLHATYAQKARHIIEYGNRLVLGDFWESGVRLPFSIKWSKEGDPTDWTDSTAGELDFLDSADYITGFGKTGTSLVVYKPDSMILGTRTGNATDPFSFSKERPGVGCIAPYSIVDVQGTNVWLGRNDFYILDGENPVPIPSESGASDESEIRYRFFKLVGPTEIKNTIGFACHAKHQVLWLANTSEGYICFAWDYKLGRWSEYTMPVNMTAFGRGAL